MATVALVAASTTLLIARGATADRLIARGALEDAPNWAGPGDPQPPGSLFKVALTQKGYIQYLRYKVDVPDLYDFTYCLWLRSNNFTSPQPIFSYSRHETQRLVRGWLRATRRGVLVQMAVRERPVMRVVAGLREGRWHHVCQGWSAARARWALHLDGELVASGLFGHVRTPHIGRCCESRSGKALRA
ncbi:Neuronal pentraxin receptor [Gryllus bimaculatus]|nr:Neuronal pentraxin receptor [Gryllus bimaculatus]